MPLLDAKLDQSDPKKVVLIVSANKNNVKDLDMSEEGMEHTVGLYGSVKLPAAFLLKGWAGHSWQSYDIDRSSLGLGSLRGGTLNRDSSARSCSLAGQVSRDFQITEAVKVAPFVGVNATWVNESAYRESAHDGANDNLRLEFAGYKDTKVYSTLGADLSYQVEQWGLRGRLVRPAHQPQLLTLRRLRRHFKLQIPNPRPDSRAAVFVLKSKTNTKTRGIAPQ